MRLPLPGDAGSSQLSPSGALIFSPETLSPGDPRLRTEYFPGQIPGTSLPPPGDQSPGHSGTQDQSCFSPSGALNFSPETLSPGVPPKNTKIFQAKSSAHPPGDLSPGHSDTQDKSCFSPQPGVKLARRLYLRAIRA